MSLFTTTTNPEAVLGYFAFRDLGDGCLGSKYGNIRNRALLSESATRSHDSDRDPTDRFIGTYVSTWLNDNTDAPIQSDQSILIIGRKRNTTGQYQLIWHTPGNQDSVLYYGEGMLWGEDLIGAYWGRQVHNSL